MTLVATVLAGEPELYSLQVAGNPKSSTAGWAVPISVETGGITATSHPGTIFFCHSAPSFKEVVS
jgi:hypothetical protein